MTMPIKCLTVRIPMDLYLRYQRANLERLESGQKPIPMQKACLDGLRQAHRYVIEKGVNYEN